MHEKYKTSSHEHFGKNNRGEIYNAYQQCPFTHLQSLIATFEIVEVGVH